jgi:hypothetical protein
LITKLSYYITIAVEKRVLCEAIFLRWDASLHPEGGMIGLYSLSYVQDFILLKDLQRISGV